MAEYLQLQYATLFTLSSLIRPPQGVKSQILPAFLGISPWDQSELTPSFNTNIPVHIGLGRTFQPQNVAKYQVIPAGLIVPTPTDNGITQIQTLAEKLVGNRKAVTLFPLPALLGLCKGIDIGEVWASFSNQE